MAPEHRRLQFRNRLLMIAKNERPADALRDLPHLLLYETAALAYALVVERDFGEGFKRYEPSRGVPQHEHLLCTVCGRVTEFRDERLERMTTLIAEAHGYARQRHRLVIYGVCATCQNRP